VQRRVEKYTAELANKEEISSKQQGNAKQESKEQFPAAIFAIADEFKTILR